MKVAIITHDFSGFTGSEIVALEVANYFSSEGHSVVVRAERHSNVMRPYLRENIEIAQNRIDIKDYDLVWSQHGHFCLNTSNLDHLKDWHGHFISVHLSGSTPAEVYHHPFASRYAPLRVFNCQEAMDLLEGNPPNIGKSFNLMNAAPEEFHHAPRVGAAKLTSLLVVSNHIPSELEEALKIAETNGIKVVRLGRAGTYRLITPADILAADAVVSIGKTVQYSLCSARPVYCYDHFGGPGWLMSENFGMAEYRNFSGRCCPNKKSPAQIFSELMFGFVAAQDFVSSNWDEFSAKYNLKNFMHSLCENLQGNYFNRKNCMEEIDAMRGALMHVEWIWADVFRKKVNENDPSQRLAESERKAEAASRELFRLQTDLAAQSQHVNDLQEAVNRLWREWYGSTILRRMVFHRSGKPRGWARKLLLKDKLGTPRPALRRVLFKKNGNIRPPFARWYAPFMTHSGKSSLALNYAQFLENRIASGDLATARTLHVITTPHTEFIGEGLAAALRNTRLTVTRSTEMPAAFDHDLYIVVAPQMFDTLPPPDKLIAVQVEQVRASRWVDES